MQMSDREYPAHPRYQLFVLLGVGLSIVLGWGLARQFAWDLFFFVGVSLLFALFNLYWMLTRLELTPNGLTVHRPWLDPLHIDYRQIVTFSEEGRFNRSLSLVYYPLNANGLVDMDSPQSLFLPSLQRQEEVVDILMQKIPQ